MLTTEDLAQGCQSSDGIGRMNQGAVQPVRGDHLVNPNIQELVLPKHLLGKGDQFIKLVLQILIPFCVCQGGPHQPSDLLHLHHMVTDNTQMTGFLIYGLNQGVI